MKYSLVLFVGLLSGCSLLQTKPEGSAPVVVEQRVQTIPAFHPPLPDKLDLSKIEWKVLTPQIMDDYIEAYKKGEAPQWVLYGLTPQGYEALSHDIAELKRLIKEQQSIIMYYRDNFKELPASPSK